jgi:hypothetical protein
METRTTNYHDARQTEKGPYLKEALISPNENLPTKS